MRKPPTWAITDTDNMFTPRESEALKHYLDGLSLSDSAARMGVEERTVQFHRLRWRRKLRLFTGNRVVTREEVVAALTSLGVATMEGGVECRN